MYMLDFEAMCRTWKSLPIGTHENAGGHRVVKKKHIALVMPKVEDWKVEGGVLFNGFVVAFPKEAHVAAFQEAAKGVAGGGIVQTFLGSIGYAGFRTSLDRKALELTLLHKRTLKQVEPIHYHVHLPLSMRVGVYTRFAKRFMLLANMGLR